MASEHAPNGNGVDSNGTGVDSNGAGVDIHTHDNGNKPTDSEPVHHRNPYAAVGPVSNTSRFQIIESTLREGEQFASAFFTTENKIRIATMLDKLGVDYLELTSTSASEQSRRDCETICKLGLKAKILTHIRCNMDDARVAVESGVDGVDVVIGTSHYLQKYSHGKSMAYITEAATEVIKFIKSAGLECRFSTEDSFRSDLGDILSLYAIADKCGVDRVGVADSEFSPQVTDLCLTYLAVGCATPLQVHELIKTVRAVVGCGIECHFHDDTGCSVANALCALQGGANLIDTSVLGIGERNGITPLGAFLARMISIDRDYVLSKYNLKMIKEIEDYVATTVGVSTPFNNAITGFCAFSHKAGIHAKAILNDPSTYEILKPSDFGLQRYISFTSRLTGWNAIKSRAQQLNLPMSDSQYKECTVKLKALGDIRPLTIEDGDTIIRTFYQNLKAGTDGPLLKTLSAGEQAQLEETEEELNKVPEKRELDEKVEEELETERLVKKAKMAA